MDNRININNTKSKNSNNSNNFVSFSNVPQIKITVADENSDKKSDSNGISSSDKNQETTTTTTENCVELKDSEINEVNGDICQENVQEIDKSEVEIIEIEAIIDKNDVGNDNDKSEVDSSEARHTLKSASSVSFDPSISKVKINCSTPPIDVNVNSKNTKIKSILQKREVAVETRNLVFGYKKAVILNYINVSVKQGSIYALLGSSGCGKTTLLRNILGRLKPRHGTVRVFGIEPDTKWSNIPGPGVGFMPQELSLTSEFTIAETLRYFGQLYHMKRELIDQRIEFLVSLLNLPDKNRRVDQLSGGQQRRTSIAATLFHQPPLLILDEPTVGLDPLLRFKVWEYLTELCKTENTTVIITTHYIEEARSANCVAMMRFGRILSQENPENLIAKHNCSNLEDVFLKLCQDDTGAIKRRMSSVLPTDKGHLDAIAEIQRRHLKKTLKSNSTQVNEQQENKYSSSRPQKHFDRERIMALLYKNCITIIKKPAFMFLFIFLPVVQMVFIGMAMGKKPHHLPISVFNAENPPDLSEAFLDKLDKSMMTIKEYNSFDHAYQQVKKGKSWLAITFAQNFSSAFDLRASSPQDADEETINESKIKTYIDMSNSIIGLFIRRALLESYRDFVIDYAKTSPEYDINSVTIPLKEEECIYGTTSQDTFDQFIVPGNVIAIIYGTPLILASFLLVLERKSGLLERSFVAGVRPSEVILSHLIVMLVALAVQVLLLMLVTFVFFRVPIHGSVFDAFGIIFMQGFQGVAVGLLISSVATNQVTSLLAAFSIVFPLLMICGVFWPMEAMPIIIKNIFMLAPLSLPITSLRFIVSRGWSFLYFDVLLGYIISSAYIFVNVCLTLIAFRFSTFRFL